MQQDNNRKIKLLKLLEILQSDTNEEHPLSTSQLCSKLGEIGIACDRRTLSKDISLLNELGYEIMSAMVGHEKVYYIEDRGFSIPELKILIDAVQAATFITEKKSHELIQKIAALGGKYCSDILNRTMVCFNTRKHSNEQIYYIVDYLEEAILAHKKVLFRYFDLDERANRVYRRNGHRYVVEPIALVFNEDNYYLTCYSAKHDNTASYRIDRMESVEIIEEVCCDKAIALREEMAEFTEQAFKMYGGERREVVLEFDRSLIGIVFDKFGEDTRMMSSADNKIVATVKIQESPTFWGWLFQFGTQMRILSPATLVEKYSSRVFSLLEQ